MHVQDRMLQALLEGLEVAIFLDVILHNIPVVGFVHTNSCASVYDV